VVAAGLLVMSALSLGGAEYYTARPDFCGTCHIMDPYYKSWSQDRHGSKLGVRCVDCHYAPGEQHTVKAKFKGLSQLASYFSGRYGTARPRAHVSDDSCLTSACHGDGAYLKKPLTIGERRTETRRVADREVAVERIPTVRFSHDKHLQIGPRLEEVSRSLDDLRSRMKSRLTKEAFDGLSAAVTAIGEHAAREAGLQAALGRLGAAEAAREAGEWMRLEHLQTRLRQLEGLTCAACHTYDATGSHHLVVDHQTCFTCHFTGEAFNRETGSCLKCHEPPVRRIAIHGGPSTATATGPAMMDHRDIVERGIDCASCHYDVIQGETQVTARECTHCHDQDRYLKNFETRTTATVEHYHAVHVARQRARCADCHRQVQHRLADPGLVAGSAAPLKPVVDDCQHCHPRHHAEQVSLLMGVGGEGVEQAMPNAMFGSRINCRACHTESGSDFKGDALVAATKSSCVACHGGDYEKLFDQWLHEIGSALAEAEKALARVQAGADQRRAAGGPVPPRADEALARSRKNIQLVKAGQGIHNKAFALQLLDLATRELDQAAQALAQD
jgi:nitrate/TMAO reductase-like tetraheme cytochrome c subunit